MNTVLRRYIENELIKQLSCSSNFNWHAIGGGSINQTYKLSSGQQSFFVKINTVNTFPSGFKEEVQGLKFLKQLDVHVPGIITSGNYKDHIYLVLNWVDSGDKTKQFWRNFGVQLSWLHQHKSNQFGLDHDNFMGALEQKNRFYPDFCTFFIENRLKPQLKLAINNGLLEHRHIDRFEKLFKELPSIIPEERASAVHGDLWSGNFICTQNEKALFIDPAVYYGHREIDLAMTTLFGGFNQEFYQSYQENLPMESGYNERFEIYNLYPLLIHLNLFGRSYLHDITRIISVF